jgi:WD40 repeat protein
MLFFKNQESISKMVSSKLTNYLVYMSTSSGKFLVFDIRGNGSISQTEQLHTDVLIDFVVTKDETFALTASLDKTINSVQIFKI